MQQKKDTTPRKKGATHTDKTSAPEPSPADYSALAHHIAGILADPLTPAVIYNDLAEAVNEVFNRLPNNRRIDESPEYITTVLTAYGESARKGGTR